MRIIFILISFLLQMLFFNPVAAGVNKKNGDFYISYTDLEVSGTKIIVRTYNSQTNYIGLFGYGWGSDFETYLFVSPSGTPAIQYNGSGKLEVFDPVENNERYDQLLASSINTMEQLLTEEEITKKGEKNTANPIAIQERFRKNLQQDEEYRLKVWRRFLDAGKVKQPEVPIGTKFRDCQ